MASVTEFYREKALFVTGGTGFLGKALVEKLLRCCPDVGVIYLLMRPKKGMNCDDRLKDLFSKRVFDLVREKNPGVFKKVKVVNGDITEDGLGLSEEDREELQRTCNIVFHSAACVRFDQKLKDAVNMNTSGTLRVLTLAESMRKLEAFVHLSTAYCRCELDALEEKVYPAVHKPRRIIDLVNWMDDQTLSHLEPKMIESEPNTYSYTKAITEDLVDEYCSKFPIAIARPSIVVAAYKEPIPGWVDNLNGPTGLVIASGKGVVRSMLCEASYTADAIPVDVVANACILIAYVTALDKRKETQVYNLTLSRVINITWEDIIKYGEQFVNEYPFTVALWYPGGDIHSYKFIHMICVFFFHILPAYFVDALLFLLGKKTFMVNLQKRISHGMSVLTYYTTKEWHFRNTNYLGLRNRISEKENDIFYTDLSVVKPSDFLRNYVLGAREFVCKEDMSTLPRARRLHKIRYRADRLVKILFFGLLIWWLYNRSYIFTSSLDSFENAMKWMTPIGKVRARNEV